MYSHETHAHTRLLLGAALALAGTGCAEDYGDRALDDDTRVVGGSVLSIEEVPHQVSIQLLGYHVCGGSIIDEQWILTAAHCLYDHGADDYYFFADEDWGTGNGFAIDIEAGVSNIVNEAGQHRAIAEIHVHPDFIDQYDALEGNDIALLKLAEPLDLSADAVSTVRLSSVEDDATDLGRLALLSGWGSAEFVPGEDNLIKRSDELQGASMTIISTEKAQGLLDDEGFSYTIVDGLVAARFGNEGVGACYGDSGGSLAIGSDSENLRLVGVPSFGLEVCGEGDTPTFFTRVSSYRDWIDGIMAVSEGSGGDTTPPDDDGGDDAQCSISTDSGLSGCTLETLCEEDTVTELDTDCYANSPTVLDALICMQDSLEADATTFELDSSYEDELRFSATVDRLGFGFLIPEVLMALNVSEGASANGYDTLAAGTRSCAVAVIADGIARLADRYPKQAQAVRDACPERNVAFPEETPNDCVGQQLVLFVCDAGSDACLDNVDDTEG